MMTYDPDMFGVPMRGKLRLINKEDYNPEEHHLPHAGERIVTGKIVLLHPDAGRGYVCLFHHWQDIFPQYVARNDANGPVSGKTYAESRQGDPVMISPIADLGKIVVVELSRLD